MYIPIKMDVLVFQIPDGIHGIRVMEWNGQFHGIPYGILENSKWIGPLRNPSPIS
jgi:hypothetical protein